MMTVMKNRRTLYNPEWESADILAFTIDLGDGVILVENTQRIFGEH